MQTLICILLVITIMLLVVLISLAVVILNLCRITRCGIDSVFDHTLFIKRFIKGLPESGIISKNS